MTKNRLAAETSPYLLQHKDNPVHWFAWGDEAFAEAKRTARPIILSIGYAACHWCHVMAHESFEDQDTADVMNALFINIKVDREERPDVDKIYMDAIHSLGEQGGWPLTMFLTSEGEPFWGGTYFPKTPQYGRPGFQQVLREISRIWNEEHDKVTKNATAIKEVLSRNANSHSEGQLTQSVLSDAASALLSAIDFNRGGLSGAPKFPQASIFTFLWQMYHRYGDDRAHDAVRTTLTHICQGGIYDHLAGGFARYSVDQFWLVPHFEKMLYDNAQLIELLANVWSFSQQPLFRMRIEETVEWMLADMRVDGGAFAASYDADSEGEEGKFYVWSKQEIEDALTPEASELFCRVYDISVPGNWEGTNIPNRLKSLELLTSDQETLLKESRQTLLAQRSKRIPPGWDDKVLSDWNGLAISALAKAGLVLEQPKWVEAAQQAFAYIMEHMWSDGTLYHSRREGRTQHHATADGYANMITGAITLYQATADEARITQALELLSAMNDQHWDEDRGGYYLSSSRAEHLIVRPHYAHDEATPNSNAIMLKALTDLAILTGDEVHSARAAKIHDAFAADVTRVYSAHAGFLSAFDHFLDPVQAVIVGPDDNPAKADLKRAIVQTAPPTTLLIHAGAQTDLPEAHAAKTQSLAKGQSAVFICHGQTCSLPISDPAEVASQFERQATDR